MVVCFRVPGGLGSNLSKTTLWMKLAVYVVGGSGNQKIDDTSPRKKAPINPLEDVMSICFDRLRIVV